MDLEQAFPDYGTFTLDAFPEHTFHLRKISVLDKKWAKKVLGKSIEEAISVEEAELKKPGFDHLSLLSSYIKIAYNQLQPDDKLKFKAQEVTLIDDAGNVSKVTLGGINLLESLISTLKEQIGLMHAVAKTIRASNALPETEKKTEEAGVVGENPAL